MDDSIGVHVMRRIYAETTRGSSKTIDPDHASEIITAAIMAEREMCLAIALRPTYRIWTKVAADQGLEFETVVHPEARRIADEIQAQNGK